MELEKLVDELRRQQQQYQTLMDTKIALDMEIAVFRRLLESEEDRLGLEVDGEGVAELYNSFICNEAILYCRWFSDQDSTALPATSHHQHRQWLDEAETFH